MPSRKASCSSSSPPSRWVVMVLAALSSSWLLLFFFSSFSSSFSSSSSWLFVNGKVSGRGTNRSIKISNESYGKIEVHWVHPQTNQKVLMSQAPVAKGATYTLDSFIGHEFEISELPNTKTNRCRSVDGVCQSTRFAVSENDDQMAKITTEFDIEFIDNKVKAHMEAGELLYDCQRLAKKTVYEAGDDNISVAANAAVEMLINCVQDGVAGSLERVNEEIAFQASVRTDIASKLENYTCLDDTLESTDDLATNQWIDKNHHRRTVHVKHDRPSSKIHVIDNFIQQDECDAMEAAAERTLHRATVADGKGGSRLSENRKAMQSGIKVPWHKELSEDNPIARLSRRVYDYTNHVLGLNIEHYGQEDLMSIQYFGRGKNDTEPDRYTPHCDGECTGLKHKYGTRMATMVMYCTVADLGGHTNFRNAGVHIKPQIGNAIYFSYINPETHIMDTGFTEHSGCPVFEGQKKIVTQWIRYGVDTENPWDSFNTLGIKLSDLEDEPEYYAEEEEEGEEEGVSADGEPGDGEEEQQMREHEAAAAGLEASEQFVQEEGLEVDMMGNSA